MSKTTTISEDFSPTSTPRLTSVYSSDDYVAQTHAFGSALKVEGWTGPNGTRGHVAIFDVTSAEAMFLKVALGTSVSVTLRNAGRDDVSGYMSVEHATALRDSLNEALAKAETPA